MVGIRPSGIAKRGQGSQPLGREGVALSGKLAAKDGDVVELVGVVALADLDEKITHKIVLILRIFDQQLDRQRVDFLLRVGDVVDAEFLVGKIARRVGRLALRREQPLEVGELFAGPEDVAVAGEVVEISEDAPLGGIAVQHCATVAAFRR